MIYINHADQVSLSPELASVIEKSIGQVIQYFEKANDFEMTVYLTDDAEIAVLNKTWMEKDGPTDVLSFPSEETDPDSGLGYLGDIVISLECAQVQADLNGHSLQDECSLLVVHGTLHLLGFDHYSPEEKTEMWGHQSQILCALGIGDIKITE